MVGKGGPQRRLVHNFHEAALHSAARPKNPESALAADWNRYPDLTDANTSHKRVQKTNKGSSVLLASRKNVLPVLFMVFGSIFMRNRKIGSTFLAVDM